MGGQMGPSRSRRGVVVSGTPGMGGACWRKVCDGLFDLFPAASVHVLFCFFCSYDLLLHAVFVEAIGKHHYPL